QCCLSLLSIPFMSLTSPYTLSLHDALPICRHSRPHTHRPAWSPPSTPSALHRHHICREEAPGQNHQGAARKFWQSALWGEYPGRSEEHTSELQSRFDLVCRLLLEKHNQTR